MVTVPDLGDIEIGEHIAVDDDERLIDPRRLGGETNSAGSVERRRFDGVCQRYTSALSIVIRLPEDVFFVAERQHDLIHTVGAEPADDMLEHRCTDHRQHLLRCGEGERSETGSEAADEHDCLHGGPPERAGVVD